jgi:segregation and condensation protein B
MSAAGIPISDFERGVEAAIFAAANPISVAELSLYMGDNADIGPALSAIQARHAGTGIELVERGGRWHFQTPADLAHLLRREREAPRPLSRAAREVLAIIAYHEPVSRAEIEAIRGVQTAKGTLDVLMDAGWVAPAGRREVPGRPLIYKTTPDFLTYFGLTSRKELPGIEELKLAGLLDPVDVAFDQLDLVKDGESE